ncbi:5'-deoxyadenosine deaminase [bacterium]|nr:5'-deoxyadenosine deaminase [bacterium]
MASFLLKNAKIVTMNPEMDIMEGDLLIKDNIIEKIDFVNDFDGDIIDCAGKVVLPGFIQVHTHLCQTLFRGCAEDMDLLNWLYKKIIPLEAKHTRESIRCSAQLGCCELLKSGTTTILDMGTVNHTDDIFQVIKEVGLRAFVGKAMMDYGPDLPEALREKTSRSIRESVELIDKWHGQCNNRIHYAFAPRFALSCTEELFREIKDIAARKDILIHTHSSENENEIEQVKELTGMRNVEYFQHLGLTDSNLVLAHCIWLDEHEFDILANSGVKVAHCPGSNLKLASGIADVPKMLDMGILVGLGADGAPCNNNLNAFNEMRLAALIQKPKHGPEAMNSSQVLKMVTSDAAKVLNMETQIGSIEKGKLADLLILDLEKCHSFSGENNDIYSRIVYSANTENVWMVMVDGKILYKDGILQTIDADKVISDSRKALKRIIDQ